VSSEPKTILETERFFLREFSEGDAKSLFLMNSDPEVIRYTGDPPFLSVEQTLDFIRVYDHYEKFGMGRWAVIDKSSGEFTGWCGLKVEVDYGGDIDLGFRFLSSWWGKGVATETATACLRHGFEKLGLHLIVGRVMPANKASSRVMEKIGMREAGDCVEDGIHLYRYEMTAQQFASDQDGETQ